MQETVLVIHGGAGTFASKTKDQEQEYKKVLQDTLIHGQAILSSGGSALDAVEAAVSMLEDCPLFNAGKGSVFSHEGTIEMDAAIMDGKELNAGSVTFVSKIKNPIQAARKVMEKSGHVMLTGKGAEEFAEKNGISIVDPKYFFTEHRWEQWQAIKNNEKTELNLGTVGAVARDRNGNLAAATSTGGMGNKKFGRIGDSCIIGAGVYANNNTCAISCTGHGEYFMRLVTAYDISALIEYNEMSLETAAFEVIKSKMLKLGGTGGVIGVDKFGNITMTFSTETMLRGFIKGNGSPEAYIFNTHSKILP